MSFSVLRSMGFRWCWGLLILPLWTGTAGARPLVQVHLSSLQAVLAATATVATAAGRPVSAEELLANWLKPFGLHDLSVLDATRPLGAVLPVEGMLLQQRGVVVALPVTASGPLLRALSGNFATRGKDGDLEVFSDTDGPVLYTLERDGYVVAGQTRQFVAGFDLGAIRPPTNGPPGSIVAELDLEPLAPLLQAGLVGAREQLRQQLQRSLAQPQDRPPGEPPVDAAALTGMLDLYLGAVQTVLMDLSRVQLGLEVRGRHMFWRNRVVARPGSATAEFSAHQGGGLPPLSRLVAPGAVSVAGQLKMTPRLRAALGEFLSRYLELISPLLAGLAPAAEPVEASAGAAEGTPYFAELGDVLTQGLDCFTGEMAAGLQFATLAGMNVAEAIGTVDTPRCRDLTQRSLALLRDLPLADNGAALVTSSAPETIRGVAAERFSVDLGTAAAELDAEDRRVLQHLYGGSILTSYVAATGAVTYYAMGGAARAQLQAMLEAAGDPGRPGIDAGTFAPLVPGSGIFVSAELPTLLAFGRDLVPRDDPERARLDQVAQVFEGAGVAGRIAAGLNFDPQGATLQVAVPLRALEAARPAQPLPPHEESPKE